MDDDTDTAGSLTPHTTLPPSACPCPQQLVEGDGGNRFGLAARLLMGRGFSSLMRGVRRGWGIGWFECHGAWKFGGWRLAGLDVDLRKSRSAREEGQFVRQDESSNWAWAWGWE